LTPWRRLAGPAAVVPASPTKDSSESKSSRYSDSEVRIFSSASLRAPSSNPRERTSPGARPTASPVLGSTPATVPRASVLWKPCP
jgi:hypothetical protein